MGVLLVSIMHVTFQIRKRELHGTDFKSDQFVTNETHGEDQSESKNLKRQLVRMNLGLN